MMTDHKRLVNKFERNTYVFIICYTLVMKLPMVSRRHITFGALMLACSLLVQRPVEASTFGAGVFGADVPFGSMTTIGISIGSSPSMTLAPSGPNFSGSGSHTVTVTSTDVVGYKLYVNATTSTSMSNGTDTIAASANGSPASLATNTWGYNTSGSTTNFKGMTLSQVEIKSMTGPYKTGDNTSITYGAIVDNSKSSGTYTVNVTYTAIGQN